MILLLAVLILAAAVYGALARSPSEDFTYNQQLDPNFFLYWKSDGTIVTFEVHTHTTGWFGLGLSQNGKMFPADAVIGWVSDNGMKHIEDFHNDAYSTPVKDSGSSDWLLDRDVGGENNGWIVLKFTRQVTVNGENKQDRNIKAGMNYVIWAYRSNTAEGALDPPDNGNLTNLYHGTHRGTVQLNLLG